MASAPRLTDYTFFQSTRMLGPSTTTLRRGRGGLTRTAGRCVSRTSSSPGLSESEATFPWLRKGQYALPLVSGRGIEALTAGSLTRSFLPALPAVLSLSPITVLESQQGIDVHSLLLPRELNSLWLSSSARVGLCEMSQFNFTTLAETTRRARVARSSARPSPKRSTC